MNFQLCGYEYHNKSCLLQPITSEDHISFLLMNILYRPQATCAEHCVESAAIGLDLSGYSNGMLPEIHGLLGSLFSPSL